MTYMNVRRLHEKVVYETRLLMSTMSSSMLRHNDLYYLRVHDNVMYRVTLQNVAYTQNTYISCRRKTCITWTRKACVCMYGKGAHCYPIDVSTIRWRTIFSCRFYWLHTASSCITIHHFLVRRDTWLSRAQKLINSNTTLCVPCSVTVRSIPIAAEKSGTMHNLWAKTTIFSSDSPRF